MVGVAAKSARLATSTTTLSFFFSFQLHTTPHPHNMHPSTRVLASNIARNEAFIVASKRTPFGAFGGKLKDLKASELGGHAGRAALATLPESVQVDQVFFG